MLGKSREIPDRTRTAKNWDGTGRGAFDLGRDLSRYNRSIVGA